MAGVSEYLREEDEKRVSPTAPVDIAPAWARHGREEIMRMRSLVTARLWK